MCQAYRLLPCFPFQKKIAAMALSLLLNDHNFSKIARLLISEILCELKHTKLIYDVQQIRKNVITLFYGYIINISVLQEWL